MGEKFIQIINWKSFQHYKDRNPPWIKLHRELMTSQTWVSSSSRDRELAVAIMLLAAATNNNIPASKAYIRRVAYLDYDPDFSNLIQLGFIQIIEIKGETQSASAALADARPETEERQSRGEAEQSSEPKGSGADAPSEAVVKFPANAPKPEDVIFGVGLKLLMSQGVSRETGASLFGRLNKDFGADTVAQVVVAAMAENPGDAKSWIIAGCRKRSGKAGSDPPQERFTGPW